jgi:hypothetical protein
MKNFFKIDTNFPALPARSYSSAPIYFEPMLGSGERITVAGVVINEQEVLVTRLISPEIAEALYGKQGRNFINLIDRALLSINTQIIQSHSLKGLLAPISGIQIGDATIVYADDVHHALAQIASLHASLCKLSALTALDEEESIITTDNTLKAWIKQVQHRVLADRPELAHCFNIKIGDGFSIHFANQEIVVNFGLISPIRLKARIDDAIVKLWHLEHLPDTFANRQRILYLGVPREDSPDMADNRVKDNINHRIESLHNQAEKSGISVNTAHSADDIAKMLIAA